MEFALPAESTCGALKCKIQILVFSLCFILIFTSLFSAVEVTCSFTIDEITREVFYNDRPLEITGGQLNSWDQLKQVTFTTDQGITRQELRIKGEDLALSVAYGWTSHCVFAGLLLHCQAKDISTGKIATDNPWHNFKTNLAQVLSLNLLCSLDFHCQGSL